MKVFISWSGEYSKGVAQAIFDFIPDVLQAVKPWMSSEDIRLGNQWPTEIKGSLQELNFGILCLTPDSVNSPWINFEAGALGKNVSNPETGVVGLLFDLTPTDFSGPLTLFQNAIFSAETMLKLLTQINSRLTPPLDQKRLERSFEHNWPFLQKRVSEVKKGLSDDVRREKKKPDRQLLEEILELVRSLSRRSHEDQVKENTCELVAKLMGINTSALVKGLIGGRITYDDIVHSLVDDYSINSAALGKVLKCLKVEVEDLKSKPYYGLVTEPLESLSFERQEKG